METSPTAQPDKITASGAASPRKLDRIMILGIAGAFVCQAILLFAFGWLNRDVLSHTDTIFYMRIAHYYVSGNLDLAISGYWGPLYSWLIAPLLGFFENPLHATRIVMGFSAIIFLWGCVSIFRSLEVSPPGIVIGAWIAALAGGAWSVQSNHPDLLMSGLIGLAIGKMVSQRWLENRTTQALAGAIWGIAYYAKAVAFPLAFMVSGVIALLWGIGHKDGRKLIYRSLRTTLIVFLAISSLWIVVLSMKYHRPVFSTSGRINHAIVGPPDTDRFHPHSRIFHIPEAGRITAAEDPTYMPYKYWSPFESVEYAKHQVFLVISNAQTILNQLMGFSSISLGVIAILAGFAVYLPRQQSFGIERWRWSGAILLTIVAIYLPVYAMDRRYYYVTFAFLVAAGLGLVLSMTDQSERRRNLPRIVGFIVVVICFVIPIAADLSQAFESTENKLKGSRAYEVAEKLKAGGLAGTAAGGSTYGLYIAFCMNQPWYGNELQPTVKSFKASGAKLIFVERNRSVIDELDNDSTFVNLDKMLFENAEQAGQFPLKVYQLIPSIPND